MKKLSAVVVIVAEVLLAAIALNGLLSGLWGLPRDPVARFIPEFISPAIKITPEEGGTRLYYDPFSSRLFWLAALLIPILHWILLTIVAKHDRSIQIRTSASESISLYKTAVVQFIQKALDELPAIGQHQVKVDQVGDGISIRIVLRLLDAENVPALQGEVEKTIREKLGRLLGADKVRRITVAVKDFGELNRHEPVRQRDVPIHARRESSIEEIGPRPVDESDSDEPKSEMLVLNRRRRAESDENAETDADREIVIHPHPDPEDRPDLKDRPEAEVISTRDDPEAEHPTPPTRHP